jgi:hypothetical protein
LKNKIYPLIFVIKSTPFPVSPTGEKLYLVLLPPWGKAGKGVKRGVINYCYELILDAGNKRF